jgi:hypothetical protein
MGLAQQFSLIHSEFNEFLYASIGEEKNGISPSVLSALTRLGLDPWAEAARLKVLPRDAAVRALAETIVALPEIDWKDSDARATAARLVDRLPKQRSAVVLPSRGKRSGDQKTRLAGTIWIACIVLGAAALFAILRG